MDDFDSRLKKNIEDPGTKMVTLDDSTLENLSEHGFEDATLAGTSKSMDCTLILAEGLSAKSFVMTFLSHVGSEKYGVYPIKGKIKNVRNLKLTNTELLDTDSRNIAAVLGLKTGREDNMLRYGHVLIMTDQDCDGIHIKALLLNLFHHMWPYLLEVEGFLQDFTTPLIKAKHKETNVVVSFKSSEEYKKWEVNRTQSELEQWTIKYYKGLASHSDEEIIAYSKNKKEHLRVFIPCKDDDEKKKLNCCMMDAFCKDNSNSRKKWLKELEDDHVPDYSEKKITIDTFIKKELILYFKEDLERSIPSLMDGLKRSQRKVMFFLCETESKNQRVYRLSGEVSEAAAYHHSEKVLEDVIIRMAQVFTGSNNINLLQPNGQFGSRREAGHDHGQSRYIRTELSPISRLLFLDVDYDLVKQRFEDGKWVEPKWYAPIVPLVLINGAIGIATGYSTTIPSYNPTKVIHNLRMLIENKPIEEMIPWYRGFKGKVEPVENKKGTYLVCAKWKLEDTKLKICDLPPGVRFDEYGKFLAALKKTNKIKSYKKIAESGKTHFEINLIQSLEQHEVKKMFKLSKKISTTNMVLLDAEGLPKHYESIEQVLMEFFDIRLHIYIQRKNKLLEGLKTELAIAKSVEQITIQQRIDNLIKTTPRELWKRDLESLEDSWNVFLHTDDC